MAGLVPAIHALKPRSKAWMPGTRPGMTITVAPSASFNVSCADDRDSGTGGSRRHQKAIRARPFPPAGPRHFAAGRARRRLGAGGAPRLVEWPLGAAAVGDFCDVPRAVARR